MAEVSAALAAAGISAACIRTEVFGAGPALVGFARSDVTARWDPGYASLLEFAEACDVPVRWSCRTGVCHTCETAVVSGTVRYAPAPVDDPAGGSALICCSQPVEDLVLDL
jgi:ferredoxin